MGRKRKPLSQLKPQAAFNRGLQHGVWISQGALRMQRHLVDAYRDAWMDAFVLLPPERVHLLRFEGDPPRRKRAAKEGTTHA